jgi:serine/threonine protein kinase
MTTSPAGALRAGDRVGRYRVESFLAAGGMGRVYRATGDSGEEVALKLVKPEVAEDPIFRRRFDREAHIAQRVTNPHLVPVLDAGEHDGLPYLAQRFIAGGSLAERLKEDGPLGLEAMVTLCLHVALGLDALHESGIVHRDLKPANVLLDEGGRAYITDFGVMKDHQASLLTRPGRTLGSTGYMAPEQIQAKTVSAKTDVYALGCVMFECVAGTPPFAHREGVRLLYAHLEEAPRDPCAGRPELPEELGATILHALEKDPGRRPRTATAYARLLQAAAGLLG